MWVLTRSDWPVLVNLAITAAITYQQVAKFDPRVRVMATSWEADHLLADCESGDEARALVRFLAQSLRQGSDFVDLNRVSLEQALATRDNAESDVL